MLLTREWEKTGHLGLEQVIYMLWWPVFALRRFLFDWIGLSINKLMAFHCHALEKYEASSLFLDGMLHRLIPNPIYSIAASITLLLIIIIYSNIYSYWYSTSYDIWTGEISFMVNLSSMMTPHKISDAVMIKKITLWHF